MTTARGDSNPYDGVLGAGGKFRKRQLRTTKTTPYDRPPTSIRNPSGTGNRNGWLSKLVDPARRLITSSAHRLFASVFTKRLPPPPQTPQLLNSETNEEPRENQPEVTSAVPPVVQGAIVGCGSPIKNTEESGVAELEEILKKKTFTRSDVISMVSHDKKEEFPKTPFRGNVTENHFVSTPVVRSTVVDEVVSAPAELAKAYMGSRTTKTFVSRPGLQNQVSRGDLTFQSNKIFPSTSSTMSLMPRSSGHVGSLRNSFVTPRSRGRSAIYSMARTPCSRVNSAITLKSSGTASDVFGGPSSSQSAWEQNRISGCRNGVLKRRNSVLDNDIGSVGPIRRIRQKSNLSSITFSVPASAGPLSAHVGVNSSAGLGSLAENGDNITPRSSFTTVPSNSSQVASKILQLDMSVSPGEKVPTNLLPSMLHGQALKSLETVDTSKFLENMHDNDELNGSCTALTGFQDSISHKHDMVKENGSTLLVGLPDKSVPAVTGARTNSLMKDNNVPSVSAAGSTVIKSVVQQPQLKSQAFQMSAHEDYLDDDDDYPNGSTQAEGRGRLDKCVTGTKSAASEAIEKPSRLSEVEPISSAAFSQKPDLKRPDESTSTEKNAGITFPVVKMAISSVQSAFVVSPSTPTANKEAISSHSNAPYMHRIGEEVSAAKQSNVAVTTYGFASTHGGDFSLVTGSSGVKLATISDKKIENSSSFATTAHGTTNHLSDKTEKENNLNEIFCRKPEAAITSSVSTSTSAGSIFEFGASKDSSTLNNGSLASSPFSFASPAPLCVPSVGQIPSSAAATNSDASVAVTTAASSTANATISCIGNPSAEASIHSFAPVFKFSSSRDPSTSVSTLSATLGEVTKSKTQDTSLGSVGIFPFGGHLLLLVLEVVFLVVHLKLKVLQATLLVQQLKSQALEIAVSVVYLLPLQTLQVAFLATHFPQ